MNQLIFGLTFSLEIIRDLFTTYLALSSSSFANVVPLGQCSTHYCCCSCCPSSRNRSCSSFGFWGQKVEGHFPPPRPRMNATVRDRWRRPLCRRPEATQQLFAAWAVLCFPGKRHKNYQLSSLFRIRNKKDPIPYQNHCLWTQSISKKHRTIRFYVVK